VAKNKENARYDMRGRGGDTTFDFCTIFIEQFQDIVGGR